MTLYSIWTNAPILHNFMLLDVFGSLFAVLIFAVVLYAPGYLVAYVTDLFGFREMGFADRSMWAIACSFSIVPIASYLIGRVVGLNGVCWLFALATVSILPMFRKKSARPSWSRQEKKSTALLVCGWTVFVLLMLVDFQVGKKLYFSVVMADQSYRIAFTDAVVRTGIPPANPLYFAGTPATMRYYYFWYILCAAVVKIAHVSARQSFIASSIWAGFGLLITVGLYTRHFFRWERRQRWIAIALLFVTGADLVPALGNVILQPSFNGDIEWWSVDPIDAWPDSLLWVPHHVTSVLCCMIGFLLLWRTLEPVSRNTRRCAIAIAGIAFASAFGLSVYVAFGFALLTVAWVVRLYVLRDFDRTRLSLRILWGALLSAVLLAPFLWELLGVHSHSVGTKTAEIKTTSAHAFSLSVRRMIDSGLLTGLPLFSGWNQSHPVLLDQTIRLILLLPGLAMELGLYGAVFVLLLFARRIRKIFPQDKARETALFFTVAGLVMTMFISSAVITNNDFGYRAVMLPQFFLLLLTAEVLGSWRISGSQVLISPTRARRGLVYSLLILGVTGSIYGAVVLRAWLPIEVPIAENGFSQLPQDNFEIRQAFAGLDRIASKTAVVAFHSIPAEVHTKDEVMTPNEFYQRMLVMDTGRQILNAEYKCAVHFGGDPAPCSEIEKETAQLYASPSPSEAWAKQFCNRFGVQYLALGHRDPNWTDKTGWVTSLPAVEREPGFVVLQCAADK